MRRVRSPNIPKFAAVAVTPGGEAIAIGGSTPNFAAVARVEGLQRREGWVVRNNLTIGIVIVTPAIEYMRAVLREKHTGQPLTIETFSGKPIAQLIGKGGTS
ncbi:MAG: hypothetical protein QM811_16650 [Pirellulales bacterium]